MSRPTKIWLIVAAALVILGIIIFVVVMTMLNWKFLKLGTVKYETNSYEIDESFRNISIDVDTSDIIILPSDDGKVKVVCYESIKEKHSVSVDNDTLIINTDDNRKWYDHIGIGFKSAKITVYLPIIYIPEYNYLFLDIETSTGGVDISRGFHFGRVDIETSIGVIKINGMSAGDVELSASTGRIEISDIICENVEIEVSTGKTKLANVKCRSLESEGNTGDISLIDVIVREKIDIERSTGDVIFDSCDAAELHIVTDTGDVKGSLLTAKIFIPRTDTGRINVPKTTSGGVCEITTDTGNIIINIE